MLYCRQIVNCVTTVFAKQLLCKTVLQCLHLSISQELLTEKSFSFKFLPDFVVIFLKTVKVNCIAEFYISTVQ